MGETLDQAYKTVRLPRRTVLQGAVVLGAVAAAPILGQPISVAARETRETPQASEFLPEVIHGIDVFGLRQEINDEPTIQRLYQQFEDVWENKGGREKADPNVRYLELYADRELYQRLEEVGEGEFVKWADRHMQKLNQILSETIPPTQLRTAIKRIVVLDPSFRKSGENLWWKNLPNISPDGGERTPTLPDVDGRWYLPEELRGKSGYYDYRQDYDPGLIHELGHYLLGIEDLYVLDFVLSDAVKNKIPDQVRTYYSAGYLMHDCAEKIDMFNALILEDMRKRGIAGRESNAGQINHDKDGLYTHYIPDVSHISVSGPDRALMKGASYKLMRIHKDGEHNSQYEEDTIETVSEGILDEKGQLTVHGDLFNGTEDDTDYVLHAILAVTAPDGRQYTQVLTPLPFAIMTLSGIAEPTIPIHLQNIAVEQGIPIVDERGNHPYDHGKAFLYEDSQGNPIRDAEGKPITCAFGEHGTGIYRLKDVTSDGYEVVGNTQRLWYTGGALHFVFQSEAHMKPPSDGEQLHSVIFLPHGQVLAHYFRPSVVIEKPGPDGKSTFQEPKANPDLVVINLKSVDRTF